jgi:hypothetical protein
VRSAIAAAWPFVFVLTTNGVVAFNVVDPTNASPPTVPLTGVPFLPAYLVGVGRRVYFVATPAGTAPAFLQAIAYLDVPQDPLVTHLAATSALVSVSQQNLSAVLPNGSGGLFVVYANGSGYPTAIVTPPIDDTTSLMPYFNQGVASGATIAASSGTRLVSYRYDSLAYAPNFALVNGAGTSAAQATTEQAVTGLGLAANQLELTTGGDGSMLWTAAIYAQTDAGTPAGIGSARLTWLLPQAATANFDTSDSVQLEAYAPATGEIVAGPPVWIDGNTAIGLAAASSASTTTTSVQVVTKTPPTLDAATRTVIPVAPNKIGAASSNGFAYVLAQDDPHNQTCHVYVFAPSCSSGDP